MSTAKEPTGVNPRVADVLAGLAAGTTVLGSLAYAALTAMCTAVYAPLGVRPSDVGLGYGDLLSRAGTAAIAAVLAVSAGLLIIASFYSMPLGLHVFGEWLQKTRPRMGKWLLRLWAGAGAAMLALAFLGLASSILLIFLLLYFLINGLLGIAGLLIRPRVWAKRKGLVIGSAVVVVAWAFLVFLVRAIQDAADLRAGRSPPAMWLHLPAPWSADVVRISPREPSKAVAELRLPECLLLLGQAAGTTVLYDANSGHERVLRLPTASLVIEVLPHKRSSVSCA